jgi:hypothetical protein
LEKKKNSAIGTETLIAGAYYGGLSKSEGGKKGKKREKLHDGKVWDWGRNEGQRRD